MGCQLSLQPLGSLGYGPTITLASLPLGLATDSAVLQRQERPPGYQ
jgi:hypothetical protein